ncbi:MAG TPA: hypothetical protein VN577_10120 [Terriglobales bacterium]|nr:hypothetical protein [Terriglobales bacterium]
MTPAEAKTVIEESRTWIGTPYAHMAMVKGAGVDCAMILKAVYEKVFPELFAGVEIEYYPPDWHLHRDDERYVDNILRYAEEIPESEVQPGDIVVIKFGRSFAHGGIVTGWPNVVHAYMNARCVIEEDFLKNKELAGRPRRFFRLKKCKE